MVEWGYHVETRRRSINYIEVAEGDVEDKHTGAAEVTTLNDDGVFGGRSGMDRVEFTSPNIKIGKRYNEGTHLGFEVSPFANPREEARGVQFRVGK